MTLVGIENVESIGAPRYGVEPARRALEEPIDRADPVANVFATIPLVTQ